MDAEIQQKLRKISESGKKVLGSIGEIIWTMNRRKITWIVCFLISGGLSQNISKRIILT